jgi:hypothetical protein
VRSADKTQNGVQCDLTKEQIEQDIEAYRNRLNRAEARPNDLPRKLIGRKLRQTRQVLLSEIRHVRTLIGYAQEALAEATD